MRIVDSQVHIWAADTPRRPWPPGRHQPHRPVPFSKDDLLAEMKAAGVHRVVLVPPGFEGERNDLVQEAARLHPDSFAVMGRIDVTAPESRGTLAGWRRQTGMLGIRLSLWRGMFRPLLEEGRAEWIWKEAEAASVPLMLLVNHDQLHFVDGVARRHPGLRLVMDHLSLAPGTKDDEAFRGLDKLLALARHSNVAVKASATPCHTSDGYPYRRIHHHLRRVYDAYGPRRMFWGSDLTRLPCSYRQAVTMFTEELPWLTSEDKEWIMGRGVCAWLGWRPQGRDDGRGTAMITLDDYFKAYAGHPEITPEMESNAEDLLERVNALREEAEADGIEFAINPKTGTYVSGEQNGGWRPVGSPVGAPNSTHKQARGIDSYDPSRRFASWCMARHDRLKALGLTMERPEWTPTWVHLQSKPVASGDIAYVPSSADPLADPPPAWA